MLSIISQTTHSCRMLPQRLDIDFRSRPSDAAIASKSTKRSRVRSQVASGNRSTKELRDLAVYRSFDTAGHHHLRSSSVVHEMHLYNLVAGLICRMPSSIGVRQLRVESPHHSSILNNRECEPKPAMYQRWLAYLRLGLP